MSNYQATTRNGEFTLAALARSAPNADFDSSNPPNDKSFPARVYNGPDVPADLPDDTPVIVSEIVEWEKEFRCFILDRSLLTYSIYLRNGELQSEAGFESTTEENSQLVAYVDKLLVDSRIQLLEATALDVGVISDRGWAIVEQNSAWGSGLYGCDADGVLSVLYRASGHRNFG